jgi:hypothetical protein
MSTLFSSYDLYAFQRIYGERRCGKNSPQQPLSVFPNSLRKLEPPRVVEDVQHISGQHLQHLIRITHIPDAPCNYGIFTNIYIP